LTLYFTYSKVNETPPASCGVSVFEILTFAKNGGEFNPERLNFTRTHSRLNAGFSLIYAPNHEIK